MDKIDLKGKVAIITGASSGIGAATAIAFAGFGATLTLVGRNEPNLLKTAKECAKQTNVVPLWLPLDLTHPDKCETVVIKTVEMYGKIDILVNCAGKFVMSSLFDESMEILDDLMNINFKVPYRLSQLALPHLIETKGNIINIGSAISRRYRPGFLSYAISKSALETFMKNVAPELECEGVRINTISPGPTKTNISRNMDSAEDLNDVVYDEINWERAQCMPNRTVLKPEEVAMLICMTASNVFPNLNGSELLIDGGVSMY